MSNYEMVVTELKEMHRLKMISTPVFKRAMIKAEKDKEEFEDPELWSDVTSIVDCLILLANI